MALINYFSKEISWKIHFQVCPIHSSYLQIGSAFSDFVCAPAVLDSQLVPLPKMEGQSIVEPLLDNPPGPIFLLDQYRHYYRLNQPSNF